MAFQRDSPSVRLGRTSEAQAQPSSPHTHATRSDRPPTHGTLGRPPSGRCTIVAPRTCESELLVATSEYDENWNSVRDTISGHGRSATDLARKIPTSAVLMATIPRRKVKVRAGTTMRVATAHTATITVTFTTGTSVEFVPRPPRQEQAARRWQIRSPRRYVRSRSSKPTRNVLDKVLKAWYKIPCFSCYATEIPVCEREIQNQSPLAPDAAKLSRPSLVYIHQKRGLASYASHAVSDPREPCHAYRAVIAIR